MMKTRTWVAAAGLSLATMLVTAVPTWAVEATPSPTPTVEQPEVPDGSIDKVDPQPEPAATDASDDSSAPPVDPVDGEPIPPAPPVEDPAREGVFETPQIIAPPSTAESVEVATPDALDELVADRAAADIGLGDSIFVGAAVAPLVDLAESVYQGEGIAQTALQTRPDLVAADLPRAEEGDLVAVEVLPQLTDGAIPGASFAARLTLGSPGAAEWLEVAFDVSGFVNALGADYGDRMQFVALPECSVTTPEVEGCLSGVPLELRRDVDGIVRLYVPAGAMDIGDISGRFSVPMSGGSGSGTIIAAVSGADGQAGTFKATDLAPRGTWGVTEPHGGFTYSIPIATPPVQAGPVPDVSLNYSSQSTDGKTSASNSQASIIGEGWSMPTSYIERLFKPCINDGGTTPQTCWSSPYSNNKNEAAYVLSLGGTTHELVWTGNGTNSATYVAVSEPTLKVTRHYGAAGRTGNGDNDGEYFEVKTPDGSVYRFGFNPTNVSDIDEARGAPGDRATKSVAWQPVYYNSTGEGTYAGTNILIDNQAYRFMLDLVIDVHGNAATYFYRPATNHYTNGTTKQYVRDLQLERVEYGQRYDAVNKSVDDAQAKVDFALASRCVDGAQFVDSTRAGTAPGAACAPYALDTANATHYPDVPTDLICGVDPCNAAQNSITYFSSVRLDSVTTSYRAPGQQWVKVETTQLIQAYPTTEDGSARSLWLDSVYTRGWGDPATAADDKDTYLTKFTGVRLKNRVDWDPTPGSGKDPQRALDRMRISNVFTDMGGRIDVTYAQADGAFQAPGVPNNVLCPQDGKDATGTNGTANWATWAAAEPVATINSAANDQLCYAVKRGSEIQLFHNYVVTSVALVDAVADTPTQTHTYVYGGKPAYALADSLLYAADSTGDTATYSSYRGFLTVSSTLGNGVGTTTTKNQYYRGVAGTITSLYDNLPRSDASDPRFAGRLESSMTTIPGSPSPLKVAATKMSYVAPPAPGVTAPSWARTGVTSEHNPHSVLVSQSLGSEHDGSWTRTTTTSTSYHGVWNVPVQNITTVADNTGAPARTTCATSYFIGSSTTYLVKPFQTVLRDTTCETGTLLSNRTFGYDGGVPGDAAALTRGLLTEERAYTTASAYSRSLATYDTSGRITAAWTPGGIGTGTWAAETAEPADVTFAYDTDGDMWTTTTARALGQVSTTWTERGHGSTTKAHGATTRDWTHYQYDALGLLVAGWAPAQWGLEDAPDLAVDYPTSLFVYDVYADGPSLRSTPVVVASAPFTLDDGEEYIGHPLSSTTRRSYTFLDGWGRVLEQHGVAPDGSADRVVTATGYNELGQVAWTSAPFTADGAARFMDSDGTTALVNAPVESLPLTTRFTYDALGRQTISRTFEGATAVNVSGVLQDTETSYSGALTTVKAADGSQVRTKVDVLGRMIEQRAIASSATDQVTTYAYSTLTDAGQVGFQRVTVTDPEGNATVFTSNLAGQKVSLSDPNAGNSSYEYDKDGRVTRVISNMGITDLDYDALGRMISRATTAPGSVSSSSATWDYVEPGETGEATDLGLLRSESATTATGVPTVGSLTTVTAHAYDDLHRPVSTTVTLPNNPVLGELPAEPYVTTYGYDDLGQQTVTGYPGAGGLDVEYVFTGYGLNGDAQTLTLQDAVENPTLSTLVVSGVSVDPVGQLLERTYGNGVSREYGWDSRRQLSALSAAFDPDGSGSQPEVKVQDETFTRDVMGRIVRSDNLVPNAGTSTVSAECFKYDGFNRLTAAWTVGGFGTPEPCGTMSPASEDDPAWDPADTSYSSTWYYTPAGRIEFSVEGPLMAPGSQLSALGYEDTDSDGTGPDVAAPAAVTSVMRQGMDLATDDFSSGDYGGGTGARWNGPWTESDDLASPVWETGGAHVDSTGLSLQAGASEEVAVARTFDASDIEELYVSIELDHWADSTEADDVLQVTATADGDPLRALSIVAAGGDGLPSGTGGTEPGLVELDLSSLLPAETIVVEVRAVGGEAEAAPADTTFHVVQAIVQGSWARGEAFEYDSAGRMMKRTVDGIETTLTWDASSNLTSTTADGVLTVYAYDAGGQRVAQATLAAGGDPGTASAYVAGMELTDPNTSSTSTGDVTGTRFYTFGGATVAVRTAQGLSLLLGDEQGSAQIMMPLHTDSNGALLPATQADADATERTAYAPYGTRRGEDLEDINRGWLGQVEDSGTGLTYLNARYYDPALGRFLSPDPLMNPGDPRTLDPYRYADNNPVVYTDASGLAPSCSGLTGDAYKACAGYASKTHNYMTGLTNKQHTANTYSAARTVTQGLKPPQRPFVGPMVTQVPFDLNPGGIADRAASEGLKMQASAGQAWVNQGDAWVYRRNNGVLAYWPAEPSARDARDALFGPTANSYAAKARWIRAGALASNVLPYVGEAVGYWANDSEGRTRYTALNVHPDDRAGLAERRAFQQTTWSFAGATGLGMLGSLAGPWGTFGGLVIGGAGAEMAATYWFDHNEGVKVDISASQSRYFEEQYIVQLPGGASICVANPTS